MFLLIHRNVSIHKLRLLALITVFVFMMLQRSRLELDEGGWNLMEGLVMYARVQRDFVLTLLTVRISSLIVLIIALRLICLLLLLKRKHSRRHVSV